MRSDCRPAAEVRVTPGLKEARAARVTATDGLRAAVDRDPEVRELADRVAEHGRRNHFTDLYSVILGRSS